MKNLLESINVFITNKPLITILLAAIIMDIICGVLRAAKQKVLNSTIGNGGLIQKGAVILTVIFLMWVDFVLHINVIAWLPQELTKLLNLSHIGLATFFALLFILFELLSIIKNLELIGVKIPKFVKNMLEHTIETIDK